MSAPETTVVHAHSTTDVGALVAMTASTPSDLVAAVQGAADVSLLLVEVDRAANGDTDALVALVSVLAALGVEHIETVEPRVVRRVFDTHRAISAGAIEVLEP